MKSIRSVALAAVVAMGMAAPVSAWAEDHFVTNGNNDGSGSFRQAVLDAIADATDSPVKIVFNHGLKVTLSGSDVVYTGERALTIIGNRSRLTTDDAALVLFTSMGANDLGSADLVITGLDFHGGRMGIKVLTGTAASGELNFTLSKSKIKDSAGFGLLIDDQGNELALKQLDGDGDPTNADCPTPDAVANECGVVIEGSTIDSPASLVVTLNDVTVTGTGFSFADNGFGFPIQDEDAVRINEGGDGDVIATFIDVKVVNNAGDGVEIDETGDGNAIVNVFDSQFNNNGTQPQNQVDKEDGFDIDEAGPGSIIATLSKVIANGNNDEGIDYDEAGAGDVRVVFSRVTVNRSADDGISSDEEDEGNSSAVLHKVVTLRNGDDGSDIDEDGDGTSNIVVIKSVANNNAEKGIDADEDGGEGETLVNLGFVALGNGDVGIDPDGDLVVVP